ncbi:hypothetical protein C4A30_04139 [Escherichia coli]|nr:hypothetical protein ESTG_03907 [Escherichia coli B799]RDP58811.1 hypothetical protein C4A51_02720 [Escherichia coli]RDP73315.1 hypothetical protein C4A46_03672 [Escherichia coli]RDQ01167.1 hypothetical protein C4A41_03662 [Escherichia coli]RDQ26316.1 hypothetical protein C4A34_03677 [Escherichia coli]
MRSSDQPKRERSLTISDIEVIWCFPLARLCRMAAVIPGNSSYSPVHHERPASDMDCYLITVIFRLSFRHHIQQKHRIAASGMMCRLYDTFRQDKPSTTFTEIKIFNQKSADNAPSAHLNSLLIRVFPFCSFSQIDKWGKSSSQYSP